MQLQAYATSHLSDTVEFPLPSFCFIQLRYMLICLLLQSSGNETAAKAFYLFSLQLQEYYLLPVREKFLMSLDTGSDFLKGLILRPAIGAVIRYNYNHDSLPEARLHRDGSDFLVDWSKPSLYAAICTFHSCSMYSLKTSILLTAFRFNYYLRCHYLPQRNLRNQGTDR